MNRFIAVCALFSANILASERPNVVVILADDLGYSDLGSQGSEIPTPNLDRLAARGVRFTQAYNTGRCLPSRAALLSGYYAQQINRDTFASGDTPGRRPAWAHLLPRYLRDAGYRSYMSGKWHLDGTPRAAGFDHALNTVNDSPPGNYFSTLGVTDDDRPVPAEAPAGYYSSTAIVDHAIACLREHTRLHAGRPFFSYIAFRAPHYPLQAPVEDIARHKGRYDAGWDALRDARYSRQQALGLLAPGLSTVERELGPWRPPSGALLSTLGPGEVTSTPAWETLTAAQRRFQAAKMEVYAAMIDRIDREVGRLVAELEAQGNLENTLILFASDNGSEASFGAPRFSHRHDPAAAPGGGDTYLSLGPGWSAAANTPFRRHKIWVHEGGISTPFFAHWPRGIANPGTCRVAPIHFVDIVPTALELAGIPSVRDNADLAAGAPPFTGRSFVSLLRSDVPERTRVLWWLHEGNRALRVGDWKIVSTRGGRWELYDLATDRIETKDLAAAQPERVAALAAEWEALSTSYRPAATP